MPSEDQRPPSCTSSSPLLLASFPRAWASQVIQAAAQVSEGAHLDLNPYCHPPQSEMKLWPEAVTLISLPCFLSPTLETHAAI